jgi:hypothetical protein
MPYFKNKISQVQWFMPVIPGTWKMEISRRVVQGQSGQKLNETLSQSTSQAW